MWIRVSRFVTVTRTPVSITSNPCKFVALSCERLDTTDIEKLTVKQISDNCGITTRAFYNHFKDKHDVPSWMYTVHMRQFMDCGLDEWNGHMSDCFTAHLNAFRNTMNYVGQNSLTDTIIDLDREKYSMHIKHEVRKSPKLLRETMYSLDYMLHGNIGIFRDQLNGKGMVKSDEYNANYSNLWDLISMYCRLLICNMWL